METYAAPTSRCPRCSSPVVVERDDEVTFLCGTEMIHDVLDGWGLDWSEDALRLCKELQRLYEAHDVRADILRLAQQQHEALAFAQSVIKCGEPWTAKCDEVIGNALTMGKMRL